MKKPYLPRDPKVTSAIMSAVRGRNNKAETLLRRALWRRGYRYVLYDRTLPGTPDFVFRRQRVAVFVDGDFWHGRVLREQGVEALTKSIRTVRRDFWIEKIQRNASRDVLTTSQLRRVGYKVIRVWEKDILKDVSKAADSIERSLRQRSKLTAARAGGR